MGEGRTVAERIADAQERQAAALERLADAAEGRAVRTPKPKRSRPQTVKVDEVSRARARAALRRAGLA